MSESVDSNVQTPTTVLFVDDEQPFLELVVPLMKRLSNGVWHVITATNAGQGLQRLQELEVHLIVIDLRMPVMDGLQFLAIVNRRYPNLQKAVMTGHATEAYRTACLAHGAELFLEKPCNPEQWQGLYASLNELLRWRPTNGFQGVLKQVSLNDVLQMECLGRSSSILEVSGHRSKGRIYIRDGSLVHAVCGSIEGEPAFQKILCLRGGTFRLLPFEDPGRRTLDGSWEFLLMEAAQMRDEAGSTIEDSLPPSANAPVTEPCLEEKSSMPAASDSGKSSITRVVTHEIRTDFLPAESCCESGRPVVDQVLVCSCHGEPQYEWRVKNPDFWVHFLEYLMRKAHQMGQELALGTFRRIVMEDGSERTTAILLADRVALVRAHFSNPFGIPENNSNSTEPGSRSQWPRVAPEFAAEVVRWLRELPDQVGVLAAGIWMGRERLGLRNWSDSLPEEVLGRTWCHLAEVVHVLKTHRLPSVAITWNYDQGALRSSVRKDGFGMGLLTTGDEARRSSNPGDSLLRAFLE
jgi:CheY-like chemotaxis protein